VEGTGITRKLYLTAFSLKVWRRVADVVRERGLELPFEEPSPEFLERSAETERRITTVVDVSPYAAAKRAAVRAHASQMDQTFFTKLPPDAFDLAFGEEHFIRALDDTGAPVPEDDLFAGLR
jgi:LmbE family N-acetylglucosaminyl deacetylase